MRWPRVVLAATAAAWGLWPTSTSAQETVTRIPIMPGLVLSSTLQSPEGDRENVVELSSADTSGVGYTWRLTEIRSNGDTLLKLLSRHVRAADLAAAPRLDPVFLPNDPEERPGYTAFSISSAVYTALRDQGTAAYSITGTESTGGVFDAVTTHLAGGVVSQRVRFKGSLTRVAAKPLPFPILLDGRRVTVPALHVRGSFKTATQARAYELWVLADSAHPLLLKSVVEGHVLQVVRVDHPPDPAEAPGLDGFGQLEGTLGRTCRVEVPGIYFAFNSASIDPASDRSLAALASVLADHPDWAITVEGHTDSVGTADANLRLSQRRAEAVRARLAERHGLNTSEWTATGFGASRPREPNSTIEGRARNRRVELARACG